MMYIFRFITTQNFILSFLLKKYGDIYQKLWYGIEIILFEDRISEPSSWDCGYKGTGILLLSFIIIT